jgi:chaperonin GroEL
VDVAKELLFGKDARDEMMKGVEAVAQLVGATLGPKGRCVVVERTFTDQAGHVQRLGPVTTKDGVSVARAISLPSANQNLGCDLIKEAALRTVA